MRKRKKRVAVLMGGVSSEREVSLESGRMVLRALDALSYVSHGVIIEKNGKWRFPPSRVLYQTGGAIEKIKSGIRADAVFIALHGEYGEDGTIQGLLEFSGIPYTGSGVLASALAMDKIRSARLFASHGISVPYAIAVSRNFWHENASAVACRVRTRIGFPCVVKPSRCGSSVGVAIVRTRRELISALRRAFAHDGTVLLQKYIAGMEVTCGVLEDKRGKTIALPPVEIVPKTSPFFDYHAKYSKGASEEIIPPRLPGGTIKQIQSTALKTHKILGCSGMSRTDMIVSRGKIYVLETNTIPGMTETSLYPQEAQAAGIPFPKLLDILIDAALTGAPHIP